MEAKARVRAAARPGHYHRGAAHGGQEHESSVGRSSGKTALQHAISAAECYMKAARTASTPADRARLKRKCEELIALAERLKGPTPGPSNTPQQSRQLPTAEKMILLRSSKLHGSIFPPWESAPGDDIFARASGEEALFRSDGPVSARGRRRSARLTPLLAMPRHCPFPTSRGRSSPAGSGRMSSSSPARLLRPARPSPRVS